MAVSVVLGARLMSSADDTVAVYVAASDLAAGQSIGDVELATRRVRFADDEQRTAYVEAGASLADLTVVRPVGAGELLPVAALGALDQQGRVQVPLSVDPDQVPPSVRAGSVVDVYVLVAGEAVPGRGGAEPALSRASVV
ncbi:MAG: hypothetical protein QM572_10740, partial [Nocardioides sp.]